MGWTFDKWRYSTLYEFNLAASGYWRTWERFAAWVVREINFTAIAGNPNIKKSSKPVRPRDLFKLSIDKEKPRLTPEEIKQTEKRLFNEPKDTVDKD